MHSANKVDVHSNTHHVKHTLSHGTSEHPSTQRVIGLWADLARNGQSELLLFQ